MTLLSSWPLAPSYACRWLLSHSNLGRHSIFACWFPALVVSYSFGPSLLLYYISSRFLFSDFCCADGVVRVDTVHLALSFALDDEISKPHLRSCMVVKITLKKSKEFRFWINTPWLVFISYWRYCFNYDSHASRVAVLILCISHIWLKPIGLRCVLMSFMEGSEQEKDDKRRKKPCLWLCSALGLLLLVTLAADSSAIRTSVGPVSLLADSQLLWLSYSFGPSLLFYYISSRFLFSDF